MYFFFIIVILAYGGMHAYALMKVSAGLGLGPAARAALALFMILMVASPFLIRGLERGGQHGPAAALAYVAYTWMGIIFLFFCSSLVMDAVRVGIWLFRRPLTPSAFTSLAVPLAASLLIAAYGIFEAANIRAQHVVLEAPELSREKLRIAQITDVHLGLIVGPQRLRQAVQIVQDARPDILVSTGDLIDNGSSLIRESIGMLKDISPPLGKFAVTGNHEFYAGLDRSLAVMKDAGFTVLRDETFTIPGVIRIAGVDDSAGVGALVPPDSRTDSKVLGTDKGDEFVLFLKHRPLVENSALGLFDLQLSGHTHKGQIFPFNLLTRLFFPLNSGLYRIAGNSYLYSSRGTGTWGPPIRFLAPPEVTIIDLVRKQHGQ